jgi:hypothetical protein
VGISKEVARFQKWFGGSTPLAYVVRPAAAVTMDQIVADFDSIEHNYINKHLETHQELAELEQPVDEGYKISQFLKKIHDESLKLTVNMIRVHGGLLMTDFHLMVSKIQECHRTAKNVATGARTIALVGVLNPRKRKGGKGGGGTGRNGTTPTKTKSGGGGGGGQKTKKPRCAPVDNPNVAITGGFYKHDVFGTLSEKQQKEAIRLHKAAGGNAMVPAYAAAPVRAMKSVAIQLPVVTVVVEAVATGDGFISVNDNDNDNKPAAVQFGRHAYHRSIKMVKLSAAVLANDDPEVVWEETPGESLVDLAYRAANPVTMAEVDRVVRPQ